MRTSFALQQQQQQHTPTTTGATISPSSIATSPRSPWHSPVPYLFGGLAAMLGLIAFALLVLTCSYWKLSSNGNDYDENGDVERGKSGEGELSVSPVFEEKILVIMAGNEKPTYLATPRFSKAALALECEKKMIMMMMASKERVCGEEAQKNKEEEGGGGQEAEQSTDSSEQTQHNQGRESANQ